MNNRDLEIKVQNIVHTLQYKKGVVSSVDVLMELGYFSKKDYQDWRNGKVDYLERICNCNLRKLSIINKTIRKTSIELKLKPSQTVYNSFGKGQKRRLRFSKSGKAEIERAYSTHYINKERIEELKEMS